MSLRAREENSSMSFWLMPLISRPCPSARLMYPTPRSAASDFFLWRFASGSGRAAAVGGANHRDAACPGQRYLLILLW